MQTWIALLRGINVGGKNPLPMKSLVALLDEIGCSQIKTYILSGNVVFQAAGRSSLPLSERICDGIESRHGFRPELLMLKVKEFETAIAANPFPNAASDPKSRHLFFLAAVPKKPDLAALENLRAESEQFELGQQVFYLHAPQGIGRSKLVAKVEKLLGVPATGRNWRTVQKIAEMAQAIE